MVSCQKGPTRHAYAWQIGLFWQDTLVIWMTNEISRGLSSRWVSGRQPTLQQLLVRTASVKIDQNDQNSSWCVIKHRLSAFSIAARRPSQKSHFRSNSKFDQNVECFSWKYDQPITTKFLHTSRQLHCCCDRLIIFQTALEILVEFRIQSKYRYWDWRLHMGGTRKHTINSFYVVATFLHTDTSCHAHWSVPPLQ